MCLLVNKISLGYYSREIFEGMLPFRSWSNQSETVYYLFIVWQRCIFKFRGESDQGLPCPEGVLTKYSVCNRLHLWSHPTVAQRPLVCFIPMGMSTGMVESFEDKSFNQA